MHIHDWTPGPARLVHDTRQPWAATVLPSSQRYSRAEITEAREREAENAASQKRKTQSVVADFGGNLRPTRISGHMGEHPGQSGK